MEVEVELDKIVGVGAVALLETQGEVEIGGDTVPYSIEKRGDKWVTFNSDTGDVKGTHDSKIKAIRQRKLLGGIRHGWKPSGAEAEK